MAAIGLWFAGLLVHAYRLGSAYATLRRAVRNAAPLPPDERVVADRLARVLGLSQAPDVRVSPDVETPLVAGIFRGVVLLPTSAMTDLSPRERAMAIGHELAHVYRRDLLYGWVPAIAERLFFFHPLARLAAREYAAEREAACDALVLRTMDVAPLEYGRLLVRLGIVGLNPVFTMGGTSPSVSSLRRRLDMLHDASARVPRATIALIALVAALAVPPYRVVARTPAAPQDGAKPAASTPAAAQAPAAQAPTAKPPGSAPPTSKPPQAARPVSRGPSRANEAEQSSLQRSIAEHRAELARAEAALKAMHSDLAALYAREQAQQEAARQRQLEETNRALEQLAARTREPGRQQAERDTTMQFLEDRLRLLTAEQEQTNIRLRALSAEIEAMRGQLERARAAQKTLER